MALSLFLVSAVPAKEPDDEPKDLPPVPVRGERPQAQRFLWDWPALYTPPVGSWLGNPGGHIAPPATSDDQRGSDRCEQPESTSPVVLASGNKILEETDFRTADGVFVFTRTYTKQGGGHGFGHNWLSPFAYTVTGTENPHWGVCQSGTGGPGEECFVDRPDFHRHSSAALRVAPFELYR